MLRATFWITRRVMSTSFTSSPFGRKVSSAVESEIVTYLFDCKHYEHILIDITDILSKVSAGKLFKIKYINTSNYMYVLLILTNNYLIHYF